MKDASPFLRPVDAIALNIPHYPQIIKNPMDFSTIERKLNSSNPAKPDPNPQNPRYHSADDFISDVRLIFQNCFTFNGPDHAVSLMGKRIEEVFDKQIKQMPPTIEVDYSSTMSDNAKHFFISQNPSRKRKRWLLHPHHPLPPSKKHRHGEHRLLYLSFVDQNKRTAVTTVGQNGRFIPHHRKICHTRMLLESNGRTSAPKMMARQSNLGFATKY